MSIPIRIIRAEFDRFHTPHTWKKNKTEYRIFLDGVRFAEAIYKKIADDLRGMKDGTLKRGESVPSQTAKGKYDYVQFILSPEQMLYQRCSECELSSEKFQSVMQHESPVDGKLVYHTFNGVQWALDNGYKIVEE